MSSTSERILRLLRSLAGALLAPGKTHTPPRSGSQHPPSPRLGGTAARSAGNSSGTMSVKRYPGDFTGKAQVSYAPQLDGDADPGEVVWTWVPFEEDHSQGKDRPVLLVGHDKSWLLGLMLTSKDHSGDARSERDYVDIGTGAWDRQGRPSEVKMDRVIRVDPAAMRREGAVLDAKRFAHVATQLKNRHGWT